MKCHLPKCQCTVYFYFFQVDCLSLTIVTATDWFDNNNKNAAGSNGCAAAFGCSLACWLAGLCTPHILKIYMT